MKILVPFDASPASKRAVEHAVRLARSAGKESVTIHLLNVRDAGTAVMDIFARDAADVGARIADAQRKSGAQLLTGPSKAAKRAGVKTEAVVLLGDPATVIASYVDNQRCDRVVMGSRGLGRVSGLALGSVASKVIHLVKVPVTLVKERTTSPK